VTPRESIIRTLAHAVGEERAAELVEERARAVLGTSGVLTDKDASTLLRAFAADQGLVGAAARLALRRQQSNEAAPSSRDVVILASIASMLESALGAEKAHAVVTDTAAALGVASDRCSRDEAIRIFETLAAMDGLVGVTARFAKARFLLRIA
jgi:hypothetical protein